MQSFSITRPLPWLIGVGAIVLFLSSSVKHALFQSNAWDLGIFDQAVYLISQGNPAISSFLEFHILADHVAIVLYPLALLYRIYPDVHWLLAVQAIALSFGCLPTYLLAQQAGIKEKTSIMLAVVYLLYPLVFNLSMADFHPEVLAIPAMLQAVYAARGKRWRWFGIWILLILSCKAALALTVVAMGVWLLVFERLSYGLSAIVVAIIWFVIATKWVIPTFGGAAASLDRHAFRYAYLGNSLPDMVRNVLSNPGLVLGRIFAWRTIDYLFLLLAPILWAVPSLKFAPLIGAVPVFLMNVLSTHAGQRNLIDQYALPILPFLILMAIEAVRSNRWILTGYRDSSLGEWNSRLNRPSVPSHTNSDRSSVHDGGLCLSSPEFHSEGIQATTRLILVWSILAFLIFAKYLFFFDYIEKLDNWQSTRAAIAQIPAQASVLTDFRLAPHLSHRSTIRLVNSARTYLSVPPERASEFDYVLLDLRHPWQGDRALIQKWIDTLKADSHFRSQFESDQIFLFKREVMNLNFPNP